MKKQEIIFRSIACAYMSGKRKFTQLELSNSLGLSLSVVNGAVRSLEEINAVRVGRRSFEVITLDRLLLYWATKRRLSNDIVYQTRIEEPVKEIEGSMPDEVAFTCYTAYKMLFRDVPADYSEVYVYAAEDSLDRIMSRFKKKEGPANVIVLSADDDLQRSITEKKLAHSSVCEAQIFVDLWNLKSWYAKDFIDAIQKRLGI
jgi:hypothetical protein